MKIGTDSVLLGAWANVGSAKGILDIGTGTGIIALVMAQRSEAKITAIEIEKNAFDEACFNFSQSPWGGRISALNLSFQDFYLETSERFDLIISNPPFFVNASKAPDKNRSNARHTDLLPWEELIAGSFSLLADTGRFAIILPVENSMRFVSLAESSGLFVSRLTGVRSKSEKPFHRFLMELSKTKIEYVVNELSIEKEIRHQFSDDYINLTKDLYLAL